MEDLNEYQVETSAADHTVAHRSQEDYFKELRAAKHVVYLAERAYEEKIMEISNDIGPTFRHRGGCDEHPDAPVLQIRVRYNSKKDRDVPFFVPLKDFPKAWLGKDARAAKAEAVSAEEEVEIEVPVTEETVYVTADHSPDPSPEVDDRQMEISETSVDLVE